MEEIRTLIKIALIEADKSTEKCDFDTADIFKSEALDLMCRLPENEEYLKQIQ